MAKPFDITPYYSSRVTFETEKSDSLARTWVIVTLSSHVLASLLNFSDSQRDLRTYGETIRHNSLLLVASNL